MPTIEKAALCAAFSIARGETRTLKPLRALAPKASAYTIPPPERVANIAEVPTDVSRS